MKKILLLSFLTLLTGCSTLDKVKELWPRAHDPILVEKYIDLDLKLNNVSCENKETIIIAKEHAEWLNKYAEFRKDPQKVSTKAIFENLEKANTGSINVCQRWISLSKIRMTTIKEAWSGR